MGWFRRRGGDLPDDADKYWSDLRYVDMGQAERAWNAQRDGWRLSYLDALHAAEHEAGLVRGHHFVAWSDTVAQLKREKRYDEALTLLLEIIGATEAEQAAAKRNAPLRALRIGVGEQAVRRRRRTGLSTLRPSTATSVTSSSRSRSSTAGKFTPGHGRGGSVPPS